MDAIVVLDAGRVVEPGSRPELTVGEGPYGRLWTAWSRARGSRLVAACHCHPSDRSYALRQTPS
ncbi:MAG: hypothetical protein ACRDSF_29325 [Pseudonocardiaceae bacterium]